METIAKIRINYGNFYNAGGYLVSGFVNGISANTYKAEEISKKMAQSAIDGANETLDIHSPSRVGFGIGNYFGMAFVKAIGSHLTPAYDASSNLAKSAENGLRLAMSNISNMVVDDLISQPTIRPVLDLTNVSKGISTINGLIPSSQTVSLAREVVTTTPRYNNVQNEHVLQTNDVSTSINDLHNDMSMLIDTVSKLQVVMDTGVLVGTLAGPMDSILGQQAVYERRSI